MFFVLTYYLVFIVINEFNDNILIIGVKVLYKIYNLQHNIDNNLLHMWIMNVIKIVETYCFIE